MFKPDDSQLLELWERGYSRRSVERCVVLLSGCESQLKTDEILQLSIGEVERRLIRFRQRLFGNDAEVSVHCPQCSEQLEVDVSLERLLQASKPGPAIGTAEFTIEDGLKVVVRVPELRDLLAVQQLNADQARQALLMRCVSSAGRSGSDSQLQLKPKDVELISEIMSTADPLANIEFEMSCPDCEHSWNAPFRIATLLWQEINDWAQRLLLQIHTLAVKYGWNQSEVLQLSRWRRQVYLNMAKQ